MIKGVNRQIVEVASTDNRYFERALLVVRPQCAATPPEQLHREAARYLDSVPGYTALRGAKRRRVLVRLLWLAAGAAVGVAVGLWLL